MSNPLSRHLQLSRATISRDVVVEAAAGKVENERTVLVTGRNDAIGTVSEFIWTNGGNQTFASSAGTLSFVSDNVNDTSAGTGARVLEFEYLDSNGDLVIFSFGFLNGTTPVNVSNVWRLNRVEVISAGTYHGSNIGTITFTLNGNTRGQILPGEGKMQSMIFTVPNNRNAHLLDFSVSAQDAGADKVVEVQIHKAKPFDAATAADEEVLRFYSNGGKFDAQLRGLPEFEEKTDIWFTASTISGTGLVSAFANFYLRPS